MRSLKNSNLYLILDTEVCSYERLFEVACEAVHFGVDIIQLRDKKGNAKDTIRFSKRLLKRLRGIIPYIVNDRVDLALSVKASGVHLGQEDLPIAFARKFLGRKAIIGASCQTFRHLLDAQKQGADYIGFGSVFKTLTKPARNPMELGLLKKVFKKAEIPVFAIGGINEENIFHLKKVGVTKVAVCRAICQARNIGKTTKILKEALA